MGIRRAERGRQTLSVLVGHAPGDIPSVQSLTGVLGTFAILFHSNGEVYPNLGGVSIPLFRGGARRDALRAARARADQARFSYEQATLVERRDAEDAYLGARTSCDQAVAEQR